MGGKLSGIACRTAPKAAAGALMAALAMCGAAWAAIPVDHALIVKTFPHDPQAFTEGLFYRDGFLYESTGLAGHSFIRKVELTTGKILQQRALDLQYFGEGIVDWKNRLVQVTWQSEIGFVYDLATFKPLATFRYPGEGWALTQDGAHIIMSDGTNTLRLLDPETLKDVGHIAVTADGQAVSNLNELEWVKGQIYANVWQTDRIARIDPQSGKVVGWIDLTDLAHTVHNSDPDAVLNGIAYDRVHDRLFVTGKLWPRIFEIRLTH
ncbi:MAG TPA: glutaminyl-peptide cyclotransferase [Rhizomicrobium sp.]